MKHYLTPSETRRYAVEMPVGDPTGGPAYGKRAMPLAAVALAASSFAAGATAFAAATTMASMVAAGAVMVGSALTIVGTVTGNSRLTKIGAILTIGGGLAGGMANPLADTATTAAKAATTGVEAAAASGADSALTAADLATAGPADVAKAASGEFGLAGPPGNTAAMTDMQSQAFLDKVAAGQEVAQPFSEEAFRQTPFKTSPATTIDAFNTQNVNDLPGMPPPFDPKVGIINQQFGNGRGASFPLSAESEGFFDKAGAWVEQNPELAKLGAEFAGGLFPSQKDKAVTELYKQRAADERRKALWATGRIA